MCARHIGSTFAVCLPRLLREGIAGYEGFICLTYLRCIWTFAANFFNSARIEIIAQALKSKPMRFRMVDGLANDPMGKLEQGQPLLPEVRD